jgi:hypothetical protein
VGPDWKTEVPFYEPLHGVLKIWLRGGIVMACVKTQAKTYQYNVAPCFMSAGAAHKIQNNKFELPC